VPHLTALANCIFWTDDYPKFLTKEYVRDLYSGPRPPKLKVIGDISCDIEGAVEVTLKVTNSGNPLFVYDVDTGEAMDGIEGRGPVILATDNLPCELPRESSTRFSKALAPLLPDLAKADFTPDFEELDLPPVWKRAVICYQGRLTPDFEYIEDYLPPSP
jgi:alpha-aminoadipic semialdehyde synthase